MKKLNPSVQRALSVLGAFCLIIVILLTSIDYNCFNRSFYRSQYQQLNNAEIIGMSEEDLTLTTEVLLDYVQDKRDDLHVQAVIDNSVREVFNDREIAHMVDVKALYLNAMLVRNVLACLVLIVGLVLWLCRDEQTKKRMAQGFFQASIVLISLAGALAFYAFLDFYQFWTTFHQIFFRNDLWLLNPNTDILIMMVPESFFANLVFRIIAGFGLGYLVCLIIALFAKKGGKVQ